MHPGGFIGLESHIFKGRGHYLNCQILLQGGKGCQKLAKIATQFC